MQAAAATAGAAATGAEGRAAEAAALIVALKEKLNQKKPKEQIEGI